MQIIFRDINPYVARAVREVFRHEIAFDVDCGDIFDAGAADAIISPANSHGWMDGGIDAVYLRRFGNDLQAKLQAKIAAEHDGLLKIGNACIIETGDVIIPWMISTPTMAVPGDVRGTNNAFLAFAAALAIAHAYELQRVLCPGLATLTGRMPPEESARQMLDAWKAHTQPLG
jgi:O-acetyl-ADP-ribose deacetylase (regulator of RNase III)